MCEKVSVVQLFWFRQKW